MWVAAWWGGRGGGYRHRCRWWCVGGLSVGGRVVGRPWCGGCLSEGGPAPGGVGPRPVFGVVRRCPTLPHPLECSTIGAVGLSFRVRNGTGRFPHAMTTVTCSPHQGSWWGGLLGVPCCEQLLILLYRPLGAVPTVVGGGGGHRVSVVLGFQKWFVVWEPHSEREQSHGV